MNAAIDIDDFCRQHNIPTPAEYAALYARCVQDVRDGRITPTTLATGHPTVRRACDALERAATDVITLKYGKRKCIMIEQGAWVERLTVSPEVERAFGLPSTLLGYPVIPMDNTASAPLTVNQLRAKHGLPPREGGDVPTKTSERGDSGQPR